MNYNGLCRLAGWCFWLVGFSAAAVSPRDASTIFGAYTTAFYNQSGTNGYFKNTQTDSSDAYFWGQANMIECVIDSYEWNSNTASQSMITNLLNGFLKNNGTVWTSYTPYNDDVMWACIAFARGGQDTGKTNYCNLAKANFDACYARGYDTNLGGGLYWLYPNNASKNACVNGPGSIAASLLYQVYGDTNYLNKATNLYAWERSVLFNPATGAIYDNISTNGTVANFSLTYNQGTFIGAADLLGQTNDAKLAANFTMVNMTTVGILPQYGIAGNNSGFNAIFLRWLTRFMKNRNLQAWYEPWLQTNAAAAWTVRRRADDLSWCQWLQPSATSSNFFAWDCIASFEALQAADPTQNSSQPDAATDYAGYWPLNVTNGNTTADLSGRGNNGILNGASWSANGRVGGCLNFNGTSSEVQITNVLCDDFTLAFWVKTTQSAGSGQWYNGVGLVDGDAPGTANDFGTALCGGKFAFGVGNPDTTIFSTSSITNGVWHQCVATRQQATGQMCVYVDGALQATGTAGKNTQNASARLLFGAIASGGGFFNGSLDEIQIFTRAMNSNEVASLYGCNVYPPPAPPAGLAAITGNAQVQLNWATAAAAASYNVKRATTSSGPYTLVTNVVGATCIDTGVVNDRTYYYVVSAVNAVGESTNSAPVSVNTTPLMAWFKADAITGLVNGASVPLWTDSSGNGYNAQQTTIGSQPTYVTGAINGLPVVRFNSTNSTYLWFYRPVQGDFTMIVVYQSRQNNQGTGTFFWNGAGLVNGDQPDTANDFGTALNATGQLIAGTGNPDASIVSGGGYNTGVPHVVTFKRTQSSGAIALYVDGASVASGTGGTQSLLAPATLDLGAVPSGAGFLNGDIAEVQIYNSPLSDTDRLALERALKCKYNLNGGSIPTGPMGLAGVAGNRQISLYWTLEAGMTSYNVWRSTNSGASYQELATALTNGSYVDTNAANGQLNFYKVTAVDGCGTGSYSGVAGVDLPLPALGLSSGTSSLGLTWPGWASDWGLYTATNLMPPVVWQPVTNVAGSNGGQFNLSLPLDTQMHFFRLSAP